MKVHSSTGDLQSNQSLQSITRADFSFLQLTIKLKKKNILSLKPQWDSGLPSYLQHVIRNWSLYQSTITEDIREFAQIIMWKIFRANYVHKQDYQYTPASAKQPLNVYEVLYPKITVIVEKLRKKMRMHTAMQEIKSRSKNVGKQSATKNFSVPNVCFNEKSKRNKKIEEKMIPITEDEVREYYDKKVRVLEMDNIEVDTYFLQFLDQQRHQSKQKTFMKAKTIAQKVNIKEDVAEINAYISQSSLWADLFNIVSSYYQKFQEPLPQDAHNLQEILNNSQNERLPNNKCLACSKFYYYNINIHDQTTCIGHVRTYQTLLKLKEFQTQLRDEICSMLNNSQGGVILFDCVRDCRNILPRGLAMTEKHKEEYEQRIQSYLTNLYPKIEPGRDVIISFVPIVEFNQGNGDKQYYAGDQAIAKNNRGYNKHSYKKGAFVGRIKVHSPNRANVYFENFDQYRFQARKFCYFLNKDGNNQLLPLFKMRRLIKRKMKMKYVPDQLDEQTKRLLGWPSLHHECDKPDRGQALLITGKIDSSSINESQNYRELSLIVIKRKNFKKIQQKLNTNGYKCLIKTHFEIYCFKILNTTGILHHNSTFRGIKNEVQTQAYNFDGKIPTLINVEGLLKIVREAKGRWLKQRDFMDYSRHFSQNFPNEDLKLYEYGESGEYYFETESKLSMVFLYFKLKDLGEKAMFKVPIDWERLQGKQREEIYRVRFWHRRGKNNESRKC